MGIKVEIVTPVASVSNVTGGSTAIEVVRATNSPIETNGSKSVVQVVGSVNIALNAIVSPTAPVDPFIGQAWIDIS